jgi:hypothetical protein
MIAAIASPPFVAAMAALRAVPEAQRLAQGANLLSPAALRAQGVQLPAGMRITTRYFEPGKPAIEFHDPLPAGAAVAVGPLRPGALEQMNPRGIGGCACGGGLTFCGGAGGSS